MARAGDGEDAPPRHRRAHASRGAPPPYRFRHPAGREGSATQAHVLTAYGAPEVLRLSAAPDPEPGPDELLVAVRAAGVNHGDTAQRQGRYAPPEPRPAVEIPGLEFSGEVLATGPRVRRHRVGERVCGLLPGGGYAERVVTHERLAMRLPGALSWEQGAAIPEAYLTAFDALFAQAELRPGEALLIHAVASGVGLAALQLAQAAGARVFGTSRQAVKCRRAEDLGATATVEVGRPETDFAAPIIAANGGRGVDVVLDLVGGAYLGRNLAVLAEGGRMVTLALKAGARAELDLGVVMAKRLRLSGSTLRPRPIEEKIALSTDFERRILPLFAAGTLRPVLDRVLPWEQAAEAHRLIEAGALVGKVVLRVG